MGVFSVLPLLVKRGLSVNGLRVSNNNFLLNGVDNNEFGLGGVVVLPPDLKLDDGVKVELTVPDNNKTVPSFAERYSAYLGIADDLPPDLASNLDHYVHARRKK